MFFFTFFQIMGTGFDLAILSIIFGFWMVFFSNTCTWYVNFIADNPTRKYVCFYERWIMGGLNEASYCESEGRWVTKDYRNYFGPTDENSNLGGRQRYAYWMGTGFIYAFFWFFITLIGALCVWAWPLALPLALIGLFAIYMRGVTRRKKKRLAEEAAIAEFTEQEKE